MTGIEAGQLIMSETQQTLEKAGLGISRGLLKLNQLLEATKPISCIKGKEADGGTVDFVDVPDKGGKIYIKRSFSDNALRETTKTGEVRVYDLTPRAKAIIDEQKHLNEFLFIRADGKPYTNKNLNHIWLAATKKAGISIKLYNAIRHSLGCQLLDEGHDLSLVQEVLGHKNPSMTRRYAKRTAKKIGQVLSMRRNNCGRVAVENKDVSNGNT